MPRLLIALVYLLVGVPAWGAARPVCDNVGATGERPNTSTRFHKEVEGVLWAIAFRCGPGPSDACQCGQLRNGDVWIAGRDAAGEATPITLSTIAVSEGVVGAEFNPVGGQGGQGVCVRCEESYRKEFNIALALPFVVPGEGSLFAGAAIAQGGDPDCFNKRGHSGCLGTAAVVTFLDLAPGDDTPGATLFRPPFAGSAAAGRGKSAPRVLLYQRDLLSSDDVLPRMDWRAINTEKATPREREWREIADRWKQPLYQSCGAQRGEMNCSFANAYRNFIPASDWPAATSYSATRADRLSIDLMDLEGPGRVAANPDKGAAIDALVQQGIDVYGQARADVAFDAGAGQGVGNLMPLALLRAHLGTGERAERVRRGIASLPPRIFAEEQQISWGSEANPTWGDGFAEPEAGVFSGRCGGSFAFWNGHFRGQCYRGATGECRSAVPRSGSQSCGDPYGFVDGTSLDPGNSYYACCSAPIILNTWWHALLIPGMRDAFGSARVEKFFNHYVARGQKVDGTWHATPRLRPDPCAPPPPRSTCGTPDDVTTCPGWRSTFGPSQADPNVCVSHDGDPDTEGRYGHRDQRDPGQAFAKMLPMNLFAEEGDANGLLDALRHCEHPGQAHLVGGTGCPEPRRANLRALQRRGLRALEAAGDP